MNSHTKMNLNETSVILIHLVFWSNLGMFSVIHGTSSDVLCLRSIKGSIEDPLNSLTSSWKFDNQTEDFLCKFSGVECWHVGENKVLALNISNMGLRGKFPMGIQFCSSLTSLDLSNNAFSGTIPSNISKLIPFVTILDLSHNNFSGEIPSSLSNCSYLNVLKLNHNQMVGNLPMELGLLGRLVTFSVAHNLLTGPVPFISAEVSPESYANNTQLCGGPLEPCHHHERELDDSFKIGFVTSFVVSVIAVFIFSNMSIKSMCTSLFSSWLQATELVMQMITLSMLGNKKKRNKADQWNHLQILKEKEITRLEKLVNKISFTELMKATDNFSVNNVIGRGKIGTMYKATLPNGWFLAVKRLQNDSEQCESQFIAELLALSRLRHENLNPLLGFCIERNEKFLVYKYMSNGNLHDWLYPVEGDSKVLEWPLRVKIAIGIAKGLAWLHHKCIFRVVHRNITTKCILLDRYFEPNISNFGNSIISNHGGAMFVYPNDNDSGLLVNSGVWESDFVKKDVYNYGNVLLELITGRKTISSSSCSSIHVILQELFDHLPNSSASSLLNDIIDKSLSGKGINGEILQFLKIASDCVQPFPYQRPTMLDVYKRLSSFGERYGIKSDPRI
ncbi:hypothetical protein FEM48_Zijuj05G0167800 [Ziziphus jujuba var. spinosa]|uniref:Protein kinase domain-containing protein n=1 Tax=Ziziphus jujuba var. spinosa TaxID=714518 RepID=A0A978VFZ1_ZIZJJ|nr:hypothetical protein FEM48_Zijuj05G0167800 [Ziziphus jujuba var. spinosa]